MDFAPETTWLFVSMWPSAEITKPVPDELDAVEPLTLGGARLSLMIAAVHVYELQHLFSKLLLPQCSQETSAMPVPPACDAF